MGIGGIPKGASRSSTAKESAKSSVDSSSQRIGNLKEEGELAESKALIIVPTSLLTNWMKEIRRFTPTLTAQVFHGVDRTLSVDHPDLLLTTYGVVRSDASRLARSYRASR